MYLYRKQRECAKQQVHAKFCENLLSGPVDILQIWVSETAIQKHFFEEICLKSLQNISVSEIYLFSAYNIFSRTTVYYQELKNLIVSFKTIRCHKSSNVSVTLDIFQITRVAGKT